MSGNLGAVAVSLVVSFAGLADACTVVGVGKKATTDGSVLTSHSNDGAGKSDPRFLKVPAADYPGGTQRPVYPATEDYPRYVGSSRNAKVYAPIGNQTLTQPIGFIPQVPHTFAYLEATYAMMNEHQVSMGESTCSGVFSAQAAGSGGKALLSIDAMTRLGLERATTAREAVQIMGGLAEKYGFYGESDSFEGSAESLVVGDPNELFVFNVLSDPTGLSAIWAATLVPDDHVAVLANMFTIHDIDLKDNSTYYGSANMFQIATDHKLCQGVDAANQTLNFMQCFSDGEYAHKYYSGRRMWGAWRLLSPQTALNASYGNLKADQPYQTSYPVLSTKLLAVKDVQATHRDWYAGTPYDMTKGLAAGAWGTPNRYSAGPGEATVTGNWERSISLFRSSETFVAQSRGFLPAEVGGTVWFGPHAAHGTCYVPFPIGMTEVPSEYNSGSQSVFSRATAFWAFRYVENIANLKFSLAIEDIKDKQELLEGASFGLQAQWDKQFQTNPDTAALTKAFEQNAQGVLSEWWQLADFLMFKYNDGWVNSGSQIPGSSDFKSVATGYPAWWLQQVGYPDGPPPPVSVSVGKQQDLQTIAFKTQAKQCISACRKVDMACVEKCLD